MKKAALAALFIVLVSIGALMFFSQKGTTPAPTPATENQPTSAVQPSTNNNSDAKIAATITYTNDGFSPRTITVKMGDTIKVVNNSSNPMEFASDPHPTHTKNQELNQPTTQPGASQTFTVTKTGTFGFHDHLMSNHTGTIVVEQ